jgi:hypothetical protein
MRPGGRRVLLCTLFVSFFADPAFPQECIDYGEFLHLVGSVHTAGAASSVAVAGSYAFVAAAGSGLEVVDISNPTAPAIVGNVDTPGAAYEMSIHLASR